MTTSGKKNDHQKGLDNNEVITESGISYLVSILEGRFGAHTAIVVNERYIDRFGNEADGHTDVEGFSKVSYLHYPALLEDAQAAVATSDRAAIIVALGRAIGAAAAHELGHQFGLLKMHSASPGFYEGTGGAADTSFFLNEKLQWTSSSQEKLQQMYGHP